VSAPEHSSLERESSAHVVAGFLAAVALFAGLVSIIWYPGRIGPGAMLIALLAAAMGGFQSRFAAFTLGIVTASWFLGMVLAVLLEQPIF
jgi:hypothetical protein